MGIIGVYDDNKSWQVNPSSLGSIGTNVSSASKWPDDIIPRQQGSPCPGFVRPMVYLHDSSGIDSSALASRKLTVLLLIQRTDG